MLCRTQGFNDASQWLKQSPTYRTWLLHGVRCVTGHYIPTERDFRDTLYRQTMLAFRQPARVG
jgi:hypothetical protein